MQSKSWHKELLRDQSQNVLMVERGDIDGVKEEEEEESDGGKGKKPFMKLHCPSSDDEGERKETDESRPK